MQVPTRDFARLGAGVTFALSARCNLRMYTASQAGSSHWAPGIRLC